MKGHAKIIVSLFVGTLIVTLSMFGVLYAGNWFLEAIGMSAARAKEILFLFLNACCGLMMALATWGCFHWYISMWRKEHKREKQENAALKTAGGNEHGHKGEI